MNRRNVLKTIAISAGHFVLNRYRSDLLQRSKLHLQRAHQVFQTATTSICHGRFGALHRCTNYGTSSR